MVMRMRARKRWPQNATRRDAMQLVGGHVTSQRNNTLSTDEEEAVVTMGLTCILFSTLLLHVSLPRGLAIAQNSDIELPYPPVNSSDGRTPLYFSLIQSFSGQYISALSLPGLQLALDLINDDETFLPGYSLHYVFTDAPVSILIAHCIMLII